MAVLRLLGEMVLAFELKIRETSKWSSFGERIRIRMLKGSRTLAGEGESS